MGRTKKVFLRKKMGRYDVNEEKNDFLDEKLMNDGDDDDDKNEKRE